MRALLPKWRNISHGENLATGNMECANISFLPSLSLEQLLPYGNDTAHNIVQLNDTAHIAQLNQKTVYGSEVVFASGELAFLVVWYSNIAIATVAYIAIVDLFVDFLTM